MIGLEEIALIIIIFALFVIILGFSVMIDIFSPRNWIVHFRNEAFKPYVERDSRRLTKSQAKYFLKVFDDAVYMKKICGWGAGKIIYKKVQ